MEYANAYSEVLEILKYISVEDYNKIPKSKIELFTIDANKEHKFSYNPNKTLDEQGVSEIAKGIIAILFRDYWATETQRNKIIAKQNYDRIKLEEKKREQYNPNDIFKNKKNIQTDLEKFQSEEITMIEYKKLNIFQKILDKIKYLFKKN